MKHNTPCKNAFAGDMYRKQCPQLLSAENEKEAWSVDLLNDVRDTLEWMIDVRLADNTDMQYGKAELVDLLDRLDEYETKHNTNA